jgi:hypothetical protein
MLKSKAWMMGVAVVLAATLLPAPSAQASELIKLGKLLVTGKRAPSTGADAKPAVPASRDSAAERYVPRADASAERGATAAPPRVSPEAVTETPAVDWGERQPIETNPRTAPGGGERVGRSPPPSNGMTPSA